MKIGISESILLILTLPAHRSKNESHRKLGDKVINLLDEYKDSEDGKVKEYNMAMIGAIYSATRLFAVERERINEKWKAVENIKNSRQRLLELCQNISPFAKGYYWIKTVTILSAVGLSIPFIFPQNYQNSWLFIGFFVIFLLLLEFISKLSEYEISKWIEEKVPSEKSKEWLNQSINEYKGILKYFIEQAVDIHLRYYPEDREIYGYNITESSQIEEMKEFLIKKHFHEFHE